MVNRQTNCRKTVDRQRFIDDVKRFVGTPYHHQGRDENGLDCVGLLLAALRCQGFSPPAPADYGKNPPGDDLLRHLEASGLFQQVPVEQRIPGDVLIFVLRRSPQHVGILVERGAGGPERMVHAADVSMRVGWATVGEGWLRRLAAVYRAI